MAAAILSDEELIAKLNSYPSLRRRMESLISAVEDETGDLKSADAAEMRVIEETRSMGQELLESWAVRQVERTSAEVEASGAWHEGKKNFTGTPPSVKSE